MQKQISTVPGAGRSKVKGSDRAARENACSALSASGSLAVLEVACDQNSAGLGSVRSKTPCSDTVGRGKRGKRAQNLLRQRPPQPGCVETNGSDRVGGRNHAGQVRIDHVGFYPCAVHQVLWPE